MAKHYYLRDLQSPTFYNIAKYLKTKGWNETGFRWRASFSEQNFEFNALAAEYLEFKHFLAQLADQYCPWTMPETYCINDQNCFSIIEKIVDQLWILKPALLNNGQHIKIFQNLDQIKKHYASLNRLGGEHVLQQYLSKPHLLRGHKYSVRMFVILTNYDGAYIYPQGYFNVALTPYDHTEFRDLSSHLTNEHLNHEKVNVIQIPSQRLDIFEKLYKPIKTIITAIIDASQQKHPNAFIHTKQRTLAIFGFDFMVDTNLRVWLLEANHGPCFPISEEHPLHNYLYNNFWQALISSFILPIATKEPLRNIKYDLFDKIL